MGRRRANGEIRETNISLWAAVEQAATRSPPLSIVRVSCLIFYPSPPPCLLYSRHTPVRFASFFSFLSFRIPGFGPVYTSGCHSAFL